MSALNLYTPNLTLLSKMGIEVTPFHPEEDTKPALFYRTALEQCRTASPLSYYTAPQPGMGLLRLHSGTLVYTAFPAENFPGEISVSLSGNSLFLFDCSFPHRIRMQSAAEYEILYFAGQSLSYFAGQLFSDTPFRQLLFSAETASRLRIVYDKTPLNHVLCHMRLNELLCRTILEHSFPHENVPSYLRSVKAELENNYYQKYTLDELALKYKKNKYQLCREFKSCFQTSPMQYLHKTRIEAAKNLLIETDLKVHEISYEVGYENTNHFITHFKKHTGTTPNEYRRRF